MRESMFWFWHLMAAIVILIVLSIHFGVMHLEGILQAFGIMSAGDVLSYAEVLVRAKTVAYLVIYLLLMWFALYHGFYGLRSIIVEMSDKMSKAGEIVVGWSIFLFGLGLAIYGSYVIIAGFVLANA